MSERSGRPVTDDVRTPPPSKPVASMNDAEFRRFVNHMLWLILDEAEPIRDLAEPIVEHSERGEVTWGPWPAMDIAECLVRWFDAGLVTLTNTAGSFPAERVRFVLANPGHWPTFGPFEPYVEATELGYATADEEWLATVQPLRGGAT